MLNIDVVVLKQVVGVQIMLVEVAYAEERASVHQHLGCTSIVQQTLAKVTTRETWD
jgi:hypothetical protein